MLSFPREMCPVFGRKFGTFKITQLKVEQFNFFAIYRAPDGLCPNGMPDHYIVFIAYHRTVLIFTLSNHFVGLRVPINKSILHPQTIPVCMPVADGQLNDSLIKRQKTANETR